MALAMAYPGGSAQRDCNARKELMILRGAPVGKEGEENVYVLIANEVIEAFQKRRLDVFKSSINAQAASRAKDARSDE